MSPPDDLPEVPPEPPPIPPPDPLPVYDPTEWKPGRLCAMSCCSSMTLDDADGVNQPLTFWLEQETTKERRATLKAMLIPLGVTDGRGVPRYTCANLDDTDPNHMVCRAYRNTPDWCSPTMSRQQCVAGPCWECGMSMGPMADKRRATATFVSPLPAVNSQHIAGQLPIGLLPHDEQRIDER